MSVFPLASLSQGAEIFIDANILVYAMTGVSMDAAGFLTRCENGDVSGFTSADVLRDVCHKLMIAEANAVYGTGIGKRPFTFRDLKANPHPV